MKMICKNCQYYEYITNPLQKSYYTKIYYKDIIGCGIKKEKVKVNDTCEKFKPKENKNN